MLKEYLKTIADAIRSKLGTTGKINAQEFANKVNKVYEKGRSYQYDFFWDNFQNYGNRKQYVYAFAYSGWRFVYNPKYTIIAQTYGLLSTFQNSDITNTKVDIEVYTSMNASFTNSKIITIPKLILKNNITEIKNPFGGCSQLKDITIEGDGKFTLSLAFGSSASLSAASIASVVNALSPTTSGQTVTFNKSAVNKAFGIDVDDETTYPEGSEYYLLRHSKDNWNFSYSV